MVGKLKKRDISVSPKKGFIGYPCATLLGHTVNAFGLPSERRNQPAIQIQASMRHCSGCTISLSTVRKRPSPGPETADDLYLSSTAPLENFSFNERCHKIRCIEISCLIKKARRQYFMRRCLSVSELLNGRFISELNSLKGIYST